MPIYDWDFSVLLENKDILIDGILMTFKILAFSLSISILVGIALGLLRSSTLKILKIPAQIIIELVRSVPPLVLLVWAYYCLPILTGLALTEYWTCVFALGLYGSVFFAEIFRSGLQAVDRGMIEAALAIGMTPIQIFRRIVSPIAFLKILPAFVGQCVMSIKNSVLGSYIAVGELLYEGSRLSTSTFRPLETLTFVALFFVITILPLSLIMNWIERRTSSKYFQR
ncbi:MULTISPECIES: amino acid ABC transporter permease [Acinetobacter calcoaceticus/baumannii complex]|uniref:amino acid ABC transporter permease n=1 Tax=Acinetobacter calcoaceticus/baumannii complex TaxID=909768 RepID=UPI00244AD8F1|nr:MULTISPECIES: amino acid ABC transporter permease [Acinetobacter calcoaceticus/baumannii complex]MDH2595932.1 amino acid ABC transporter permease [Acinetobacter baumannii]MDO7536693.1 amino acid ABC transporter permease [Acinetobacter pittii]